MYQILWECIRERGLNLLEWLWEGIQGEVVFEMGIKRRRGFYQVE